MNMKAVNTVFWSDPEANGVNTDTAFPNAVVVAITFRNQGTAIVTLGDTVKLNTGDTFEVDCKWNRYDCTFYKIAYGAGTRDLAVIAQVLSV